MEGIEELRDQGVDDLPHTDCGVLQRLGYR